MKPLPLAGDSRPFPTVRDGLGRRLRTLRLSVTDRCNLRCRYCMPDESNDWIIGRDILTFEELAILAAAFVRCGVDRIRLTGGEPILRRGLDQLVSMLRHVNRDGEICLTTNGVLLDRHTGSLARAGLDRVTVSLDSLDRETFWRMTSRDLLPRVLAGIEAAQQAGFRSIKLNCVVFRGVNDQELPRLIAYAQQIGAEVRFIEHMELAGARHWTRDSFVSGQEMLQIIESAFGRIERVSQARHGTAERYRCPDGTTFGIIAPVTSPFCDTCTRGRLTADGWCYLCLHAESGFDLKSIVRSDLRHEQVADMIATIWERRRNCGAQERLRNNHRLQSARPVPIRMNVRGG